MTSPLKSSDFNPPSPLVEICLKCESTLQKDVTNSHYPLPLTKRISCYLRHSLQENILSASSHNIIFKKTVLATKSSHIKVPSEVSLIDCLVFKQQKII